MCTVHSSQGARGVPEVLVVAYYSNGGYRIREYCAWPSRTLRPALRIIGRELSRCAGACNRVPGGCGLSAELHGLCDRSCAQSARSVGRQAEQLLVKWAHCWARYASGLGVLALFWRAWLAFVGDAGPEARHPRCSRYGPCSRAGAIDHPDPGCKRFG